MPERMFEQQLVWLTVSVISGHAHLTLWHLVVGEHDRGGRSPPCYLENKELKKENSRTQPQWLNFLRRSPPLDDIITSCWHHSGGSKPSIWDLWRTFQTQAIVLKIPKEVMYSLSHSRPKLAVGTRHVQSSMDFQSPQILASPCTLTTLAFSQIAELSENFVPPKFLGTQSTLSLYPLAPLELQ